MNARPHKAKVTQQWLEDNNIQCFEWPANSPNLNPIENLWAELKRRLGEYESPPEGILQLWSRVQEVWNGFGEDYCQKLIESMPNCMAWVIKRKGKSIPIEHVCIMNNVWLGHNLSHDPLVLLLLYLRRLMSERHV